MHVLMHPWSRMVAVGVACALSILPADALGQPIGHPAVREGAAPGNQRADYLMGMQMLRGGQPRRAMQIFQGILEQRPNHERARLGMLEAMAATGICGNAEAMFVEIEGTVRDHARARSAYAQCAEALGDYEAALAFHRDAVELDPYEPRYLYDLASLLSRMGREDEAESARAALFGTERGPGYAFLAEAEALWRQGSPMAPAARRQLAPFAFLEDVRRGQYVLEALQVIDEECATQPDLVLRLSMVNPVVAARSAECVRRSGDVEGAMIRVDRPNLRSRRLSPELAPFLARVQVDLGELEAAERTLAGLPESLATVLASRWYLARARGDADAMAWWAERYEAHPDHVREPLEALVPAE